MKNFIKYICFTLVIILITSFSLTACGDSEIKQLKKAQSRMIEIGDQLLDYDITIDEALNKMNSIALPDTDDALHLSILKMSFEYDLQKGISGKPNFEALKKDVDDIKNLNID